MGGFVEFFEASGVANASVGNLIMIAAGLLFVYLGVFRGFEPLLLVPIGFGVILGNMPVEPGAGLGVYDDGSVLNQLYYGVISGVYPPLIFLGIGAMTDFSTLISQPKLILLGAAAQIGVTGVLIATNATLCVSSLRRRKSASPPPRRFCG